VGPAGVVFRYIVRLSASDVLPRVGTIWCVPVSNGRTSFPVPVFPVRFPSWLPVLRPASSAIASVVLTAALLLVPGQASAQDPEDMLAGRCATPDSIVVRGASRVSEGIIRNEGGLVAGERLNFQSLQRAIKALFALGEFHDVSLECDLEAVPDRALVVYRVQERALLGDVSVEGVAKVSQRSVRDKVTLLIGRPVDPADIATSRARIDSVYQAAGYYLATVTPDSTELPDGRLAVTFKIDEGRRLAISGLEFVGASSVKANVVAGAMQTKPEGFWFFRKGEYDDEKFAGDLGERIPSLYSKLGHIDARVLEDTLVVDPELGKGKLRITIDEGPKYRIGTFGITGNRAVPTEMLDQMYQASGARPGLRAGPLRVLQRDARAERCSTSLTRPATPDPGSPRACSVS
jgi:outer membrane protein insertion porin family